jgi:hypothetical protein
MALGQFSSLSRVTRCSLSIKCTLHSADCVPAPGSSAESRSDPCFCGALKISSGNQGHFHCAHCDFVSKLKFAVLRHENLQHKAGNFHLPLSAASNKMAGSGNERVLQWLKKAENDGESTSANQTELDVESTSEPQLRETVETCSDTKPIARTNDDKKWVTKITIDMNGVERTEKVEPYSGPIALPAKQVPGKKAPCPRCKERFVRLTTLRNHLATAHNIVLPGQSYYRCMPCKFVTSFDYVFASHRFSLLHQSVMESARQFLVAEPNVNTVSGSTACPDLPMVVKPVLQTGFTSIGVANASASEVSKTSTASQRTPSPVAIRTSTPTSGSDATAPVEPVHPTRSAERQRVFRMTLNRIKWFYGGVPNAATANQKIGAVTVSPATRLLWNGTEHECAAEGCRHRDPVTASPERRPAVSGGSGAKRRLPLKQTARKSTTTKPRKERLSDRGQEFMVFDTDDEDGSRQPVVIDASDDETSNASRIRILSVAGNQKFNDAYHRGSDSDVILVDNSNIGSTAFTNETVNAKSPPVLPSSADCQQPPAVPFGMPISYALLPLLMSQLVNTFTPPSQQPTTAQQAAVDGPPASSLDKSFAAPDLNLSQQQQMTSLLASSAAAPQCDRPAGCEPPAALDQFSPEVLWAELCRRGRIRSCSCDMYFTDVALYHLHRSCHASDSPLRCGFCRHDATSVYDFQGHLLDHRK